MRNILAQLILAVCSNFIFGQNLVPNYSFETYTACPDGPSQIHLAAPWSGPTNNSSEYYNYCSENWNPALGTQAPRTGNAYAGIFCYNPGFPDYKEYLQVELTDSLKSNNSYYVEFYVTLSQRYRFGVNNMGAHFSNHPNLSNGTEPFLNLTPHILLEGNPIITDTANWTKISGTYIASGGEKYLTIGNFFSDANTSVAIVQDSLGVPGIYNGSIYIVDDVKVINSVFTSNNEVDATNKVQIFPNPFSTETTIQINENLKNAMLIAYNSTGQQVRQIKIIDGQTIKFQRDNLSNGLYFLQLTDGHKTIWIKQLIISN